ncbi:MAG: hypothetical protein LBK52_00175, partial [Deltaproteobacteria bacterium]|nr:hypothetical protein [Deltaproteobacteria bacterium]
MFSGVFRGFPRFSEVFRGFPDPDPDRSRPGIRGFPDLDSERSRPGIRGFPDRRPIGAAPVSGVFRTP